LTRFARCTTRTCWCSIPAASAISFLALRDIVFVLTSCSVDYWPLNNGRCTPLQILVIAG